MTRRAGRDDADGLIAGPDACEGRSANAVPVARKRKGVPRPWVEAARLAGPTVAGPTVAGTTIAGMTGDTDVGQAEDAAVLAAGSALGPALGPDSAPETASDLGPDRDLVAELARLPIVHRAEIVRKLTRGQRNELRDRWRHWAHAGQYPPEGDWRIWLIRAGRGFGKTRAGAEWVWQVARAYPDARIALVGATLDDVRRVMIEGESGLIAVAHDDEEPVWRGAVGELHFANGAKAYAYSAEAPESLRGDCRSGIGRFRCGRGPGGSCFP